MLQGVLHLRNFNHKMGEAPGDYLMIRRRVTLTAGAVNIDLSDMIKPGAIVEYFVAQQTMVGDGNNTTTNGVVQFPPTGNYIPNNNTPGDLVTPGATDVAIVYVLCRAEDLTDQWFNQNLPAIERKLQS